MYEWGPVSVHCGNRCKPATPSRLPLSHQQLLLLTPPLAAVPRDQKHHPAPPGPPRVLAVQVTLSLCLRGAL